MKYLNTLFLALLTIGLFLIAYNFRHEYHDERWRTDRWTGKRERWDTLTDKWMGVFAFRELESERYARLAEEEARKLEAEKQKKLEQDVHQWEELQQSVATVDDARQLCARFTEVQRIDHILFEEKPADTNSIAAKRYKIVSLCMDENYEGVLALIKGNE